MYKMCHYEAAMDKIGEDIPWIEDEQNLPVRTYGGIFYHKNFQRVEANLSHFFICWVKMYLDFIGITEINLFLCRNYSN